MTDILEYVPDGYILRDIQKEFLLWFQDNYHTHDVIVGSLAVATGKSLIAITIANWLSSKNHGMVALNTPTKILQDQYERDFDWIPILKGSSNYNCYCDPKVSCDRAKSYRGSYCKPNPDEGVYHMCNYLTAVKIAAEAPIAIFNLHSMSYTKLWKPNVIIDECQNIEEHIIGRFGTKIWEFQTKSRGLEFPPDIETNELFNGSKRANNDALVKFLRLYLEEIDKEYNATVAMAGQNLLASKTADALKEEIMQISSVIAGISSHSKDMLVLIKHETYKGRESIYKDYYEKDVKNIYIKPLKVGGLAEAVLWPKSVVKKIILFSATVNEQDLVDLSLSGRKCAFFKGKSPIPKENRPFIVWPVASMSWRNRKENTPRVVAAVLKLAEKYSNDKGVVHCTYEVAKAIREISGDNQHFKRFLFHSQKDKTQIYNKFRESKQPLILIASGMSEGIDLPGDLARWQAMCMVVRPSIEDDVNFYQIKYEQDKYDWRTVRTIEQTSGRVCRGPTDKGATYILVSEFDQLFEKTHTRRIENGKPSLWEDWFIESIIR